MATKTFNVKKFKDEINARLESAYNSHEIINFPDKYNAVCEALCHSIEYVLHQSGNYRGFQYIHWLKDGCKQWEGAGKPEYPEQGKYVTGGKEFCRKYY
jgi:hypothetical protein